MVSGCRVLGREVIGVQRDAVSPRGPSHSRMHDRKNRYRDHFDRL